MAATVSSSVWGVKSKPGAWALDSEQHEDDLMRDLQSHPQPPSSDFPSLSAAAATKTKKKKPQTLSLAEFSTYSAPKAPPARLTTDELLSLPTGPRERSVEELERSRSGFGGGFRSYGYDSANPRARVSERGNSRADDGLSRADEADDWSKAKKFTGADGDRRDKVGFFNSSRADEVDNWASNKSFAPSEGRRERRMGFDSSSNGADLDNWTRAKGDRGVSNGPRFERERRGVGFESSGAADSDNWLKKKETDGGVVDAGRPRLNLQRRTVSVTNENGGLEVKPKGSNPFGEARPREEVLKGKGQDWKEVDDKLEALKAKEETDNGSDLRRKGFGMGRNDSFKDDLMHKASWRKEETEIAQPASCAYNAENGDADKAVDAAAENTENGVGGAINGTYGGAVVSGIVFCDQCKDGRVSLFDYPLSGVKVAMLCPGTDTQMEMVGQETTNMFGGYTMRFDGSPDLSGCYAQVNAAAGGNGEADSSSCQASAGPAESLRLTFSFFGMEFYAVNVLISQPAQPLSFCPGSHESRPSPTAPPVVVIPPTPPLAPPVVVNPPTPPAPPSQSPPKAPAFRLPPMPPLPPLPSMPPMPFLEASACSHEYWMMPEYRCYWRVLNPDMKVGLIFGPLASDKYGTDMTLWEGLQGRADPYRTLLREGITALLNSYNSFQFPYTSLGVVQSLNLALMDTPQTTLLTALRFMRANSGYSDANSNPSCKLKSCKS